MVDQFTAEAQGPRGTRRRKLSGFSLRNLCILCVSAVNLVAAPPQRIISTAPSVTEMLYALGLGDKVVGVTTFCHYPPEVTKKPKIGNYLQPNIEVILSLRPDLIVAERTGVRQAEKLIGAGAKILDIEDGSLAQIYDAIRIIGGVTGVPDRAAQLAGRIRGELDEIRSRTARLPKRKLMFIVGRTPGRLEDLIVVGRGSHLNELMEIAGCENIFGGAVAAYAKVSMEEVLARSPDIIVDMGEMSQTVGVTEQQKRAVVALWARVPALAAVRRKAVFAVASDIFVVPGPRVVDAAREFARMAHPESGL